MNIDRRRLLGGAGLSLAFSVAGERLLLTPREAHARSVGTRVLSPAQAGTLAALGDALVEGASEAGLVEFVDHQLGETANDCLLGARFFNIEPPYAPFYQAGLDAFAGWAKARADADFGELAPDEQAALVGEIAAGMPADWQGPPAPLLYLLVRSDAVDVVWGTPEGFESLDIPYMAHIMPPSKW